MKKFFTVFSVSSMILLSSAISAQTVKDGISYDPSKAFFTAEVLDAIYKTAETAGIVKDLPKNLTNMSKTEIAELGQKAFKTIAKKIELTGIIKTGERDKTNIIGNVNDRIVFDITQLGYKTPVPVEQTDKVDVYGQTDQYVLTRELASFFSDTDVLNFWKNFNETKSVANFSYAVDQCLLLNEKISSVILESPDAISYGIKNVKEAFIASKFPVDATEIINKDLTVLEALKTLKTTLETVPVTKKVQPFIFSPRIVN